MMNARFFSAATAVTITIGVLYVVSALGQPLTSPQQMTTEVVLLRNKIQALGNQVQALKNELT